MQQSRAGKRWAAPGLWEGVCMRVHVDIWVCVLKWTTKQKTLVALRSFINTAVCLVWATPGDRHTDRRTDRHIYIIYSCPHPYLRDTKHKQTTELQTDYFTKPYTKTWKASENWAEWKGKTVLARGLFNDLHDLLHHIIGDSVLYGKFSNKWMSAVKQ